MTSNKEKENAFIFKQLLEEIYKKKQLELDVESLRKIVLAQSNEISRYRKLAFNIYYKGAK